MGCTSVTRSATQNSHLLVKIDSAIVIGFRVRPRTRSEIPASTEISEISAYRGHLNRGFLGDEIISSSIASLDNTVALVLPKILRHVLVNFNCTSTGISTSTSFAFRNCTSAIRSPSAFTFSKVEPSQL